MRLPGADRAIVDEAKVRDYLLSPEHPVGRFKAAFFASIGYTRQNWEELKQVFLSIAASENATRGQPSGYGQKYEVRGKIEGRSRRHFEIITVWIVLRGEDAPSFVTAFPG